MIDDGAPERVGSDDAEAGGGQGVLNWVACTRCKKWRISEQPHADDDTEWVCGDIGRACSEPQDKTPTPMNFPTHFIGHKVEKAFEGHDGKFEGTVSGYDRSEVLFKIVYDDGDEEELTAAELSVILVSE